MALALCLLARTPAHADGAGYAIELDGIRGYLGCPLGGIRGCNDITLSAWVFPEGPRGDLISPEPRGQAAVGLGFHFGLSGGKVFCAKGSGTGGYVFLIGATAVPVSEWHHVAATFDGLTMRVYLDGVLDGSLADGAAIVWDDLPLESPPGQLNFPTPAQLYLGADKSNQLGLGPTTPDFSFYEGAIDEAQVWNRALSQAEIDFYRRIDLTGTETGLIDYWKFNEGTGTTAADVVSPNGNLTLFPGATWIVSTAPVKVTGVDPAGNAVRTARLTVYPSPAPGRATILLEPASSEAARVSVLDLGGRRIARLWSGTTSAGNPLWLRWDGRDQDGRAAASGVYLVRYESASARLVTRCLILR